MNSTLHAEWSTNTTILSYPDFRSLPKGIKQMLVASEAYFFEQPASHSLRQKATAGFKVLFQIGTERTGALIYPGNLIGAFAPS